MIPDAQERPLLTVEEFLEAVPGWPRGRSATHDAIRRGELPSIRISGRVFLVTAQLRQMLGLNDESPSSRNEAPASTTEASPTPHATPDRQVRSHDGFYTPSPAG